MTAEALSSVKDSGRAAALLWVTIECALGQLEAQLWLWAYAIPQARVEEFGKHAEELLDRIFA